MNNLKNKAGFTLVELIVVIAILAILAGVAVPAYSGYMDKAREAKDASLLSALNTAFAAACLENGYNMTDVTATFANDTGLAVTAVGSLAGDDLTAKQTAIVADFGVLFGDNEFAYYTVFAQGTDGNFTGSSN